MPDREHTSKHYEQQLRELKDKLLLMSHKAEQMISDSIRSLVRDAEHQARDAAIRGDDGMRSEIGTGRSPLFSRLVDRSVCLEKVRRLIDRQLAFKNGDLLLHQHREVTLGAFLMASALQGHYAGAVGWEAVNVFFALFASFAVKAL